MRILKWQGKVSFEDSVAGGENPFCYHPPSYHRYFYPPYYTYSRRYMLQPKDLKSGRMYYGSVPFPQINSGDFNPCPDLNQGLIRVKKGQKPSKKAKNSPKRGGVPETPFLP